MCVTSFRCITIYRYSTATDISSRPRRRASPPRAEAAAATKWSDGFCRLPGRRRERFDRRRAVVAPGAPVVPPAVVAAGELHLELRPAGREVEGAAVVDELLPHVARVDVLERRASERPRVDDVR